MSGRTRTISDLHFASDCMQYYNNDPPIFRGSGGVIGMESTITDQVTPNYRLRRKRGEIIMNPMVLKKYESARGSGLWVASNVDGYGSGRLEGDMISPISTHITGFSPGYGHEKSGNVQNDAVLNAYVQLNQAPVIGGELLADLGKTLAMLRQPFSRAEDLILQIQRLARKRKKHYVKTGNRQLERGLKAFASAWLETRYGWQPLMMDISETMSQVHVIMDRITSKPAIRVARGSARASVYDGAPFTALLSAWSIEGACEWSSEIRSNAGIIYQQRLTSLAEQVSRTLGLDAQAIPGTLWEIMPYSFVVDWFIGVGDWLHAVMPRSDIEIRSSWVTNVVVNTSKVGEAKVTRTIGTPPTEVSGKTGPAEQIWTVVERLVNPSLPSLPLVKTQPLRPLHVIDALSLSMGKIIHGFKKVAGND